MKILMLVACLIGCAARSQTATFSFEGDSISETNQFRWDYFFTGMMQSKLPGSDFHIWALSGDTASNMVGEYFSQAHTRAPVTNLGFFTLLAGINDLRAGDTAVHVQSNLATIWGFAREDGFKVAAFTITPDYNQPSNSSFWQEWTNLNAWIETQSNAYDYLVPMASNILQSDLADGLHPSFSGSQKLALLVSNVLFNAPSMLSAPTNSGGNLVFSVNGPNGNTYVVQSSSNLVSWDNMGTNFIPSSGGFLVTATNTNSAQFFRAQLVR